MSQIAVRVDDKLKKDATEVFNELGLDMSTAIKLFLKQSILTKRMEIKEISYQDRVPKNMISKFNYFVRDFLNEYSDQLDEMEAGSDMIVKKEYEGDLEVYFVEFMFNKKGGGFFTGNLNNSLFVTCNNEFWGTVILE